MQPHEILGLSGYLGYFSRPIVHIFGILKNQRNECVLLRFRCITRTRENVAEKNMTGEASIYKSA